VPRNLQPLGVLIEHGVNDVNKGLVAGEEPVPARKQIPFQPTLTKMLAQNLHNPAIGREVLVGFQNLAGKNPVGSLKATR
jgi:hypothetical protein